MKPQLNWEPKNRKERSVRIPTELVKALRDRQKKHPGDKLIFPNQHGRPEGHFLWLLKKRAFAAGLNCGDCISHRAGKEVSCADGPYCKVWGIHKFRKTFATTHFINGFSVPQISEWLGHESQATTLIYLADVELSQTKAQAGVDSSFENLDAAHEAEAAGA